MYFDFFTIQHDDVTCSQCSWKGKGSEMSNGDFFEESYIAEFHCPKCYNYLGFVQFPTTAEEKKWKAKNPGKKTGWE